MGDAEDDYNAVRYSAAGVHKSHDAVDDAIDVRLLYTVFREWAGPILDNVKYTRYSSTRFCRWLGPYRHCHSYSVEKRAVTSRGDCPFG